MGFEEDEMCPHGFRAMASTLLNELGYNRDWIERQLAHAPTEQIRGICNRAEYLPERRNMLQEWADYLDGLRAKARQEAELEQGNDIPFTTTGDILMKNWRKNLSCVCRRFLNSSPCAKAHGDKAARKEVSPSR